MRGNRPAAGDRHGRGFRADNDRRRRPGDGFRVRDATRFGQIVDEAIATLPARLAGPVEQARITVLAVPPVSAATASAPEQPQLADFSSAGRLTVYRRPLESRADDRAELVAVVRLAVGEAVARALGIDDDLDDLFDDGW